MWYFDSKREAGGLALLNTRHTNGYNDDMYFCWWTAKTSAVESVLFCFVFASEKKKKKRQDGDFFLGGGAVVVWSRLHHHHQLRDSDEAIVI